MAIFKSTTFAAISGSIDGVVFSHNKGGSYTRALKIPTNPQTPAQSTARSRFGDPAADYRALVEADRQTFINFGEESPRVNAIGVPHPISGINAFISINKNIATAGGIALTVAPAPVGATAVTTISITASTGPDLVEVAFAPDPIPLDHALVIQTTIPLSPGISNANSLFRQTSVETATAISPADITTQYTAQFGSLIVSQRVFVRGYLIRLSTGEVSVFLQNSTIVT